MSNYNELMQQIRQDAMIWEDEGNDAIFSAAIICRDVSEREEIFNAVAANALQRRVAVIAFAPDHLKGHYLTKAYFWNVSPHEMTGEGSTWGLIVNRHEIDHNIWVHNPPKDEHFVAQMPEMTVRDETPEEIRHQAYLKHLELVNNNAQVRHQREMQLLREEDRRQIELHNARMELLK